MIISPLYFCLKGVLILKTCPNCGNKCADEDKFCMECGTKFDAENTNLNKATINTKPNVLPKQVPNEIQDDGYSVIDKKDDEDVPITEELPSDEVDTSYYKSTREHEDVYEAIDTSVYEKENKITIKSKEQEKKVLYVLIAVSVIFFILLVVAIVFIILSNRDNDFMKFSENWQQINASLGHIAQNLMN